MSDKWTKKDHRRWAIEAAVASTHDRKAGTREIKRRAAALLGFVKNGK